MNNKQLYETCYVNWRRWYELAERAQSERWGFANGDITVFCLYMQQIFARLAIEAKIMISEPYGLLAFNSGLATDAGEDLLVCLRKRHRKQSFKDREFEWVYDGFCTYGTGELGICVKRAFGREPQRARFAELPAWSMRANVLDTMSLNIDHIIRDNLARFPAAYLEEKLGDHPDAFRAYLRARVFVEPAVRVAGQQDGVALVKRLYAEAYNTIAGDVALMLSIERDIRGFVRQACARVADDKSAVVPIYHPRYLCMSLLLPLCVCGTDDADLALVVGLDGNRLRGNTVLDLQQAYIDARLVGPVHAAWLKGVVR